MAARLVQNISDDYLTCPICLQRFIEPRKLLCEHTFCTDCLQKHIDNTIVQTVDVVSFSCPLCRTEVSKPRHNIEVRNWVKNFPLDNLIHDLVTTLSIHERQLTPQHSLQRTKCQVHPKNERDIFCVHHLKLTCSKCADVEHISRNCELLTIEEAFNQLKPKIEETRKRLYLQALKLENYFKVDTKFNQQKTGALDGINNLEHRLDQFRERCNQQLAIQRSDIERLNKEHIDERKSFYSLAACLLESQSKLESLCESSNRREVLSELDDLSKSVEKNEKELNGFSQVSPEGNVHFTINRELDRFLNSFSALGFVDKSSPKSFLDEYRPDSDRTTLPPSLKCILNRRESPRTMAQNCGKLIPKKKFSGKLPTEDKCWLIRIIVLPDSTICALDKENARLKRYDDQGNLVNCLLLVDVPYSMALLKPSNDIVITKPDKEILEFVTTESKELSVRKYVPTGKKYVGVCQVKEDVMAVSSWSQCCVDLIDGNGWVLTTISADLKIPDMLCVTGNEEIIVIDKGTKLVCFEFTGKVKWSIYNEDVINDINYSEKGNIFICCKDANKICIVKNSSGASSNVAIVPYQLNVCKPLDTCQWKSQFYVALENGYIEILSEEACN